MAIGPAGRVVAFLCVSCKEPTEPANEAELAEIAVEKAGQGYPCKSTSGDTSVAWLHLAADDLLSMHDINDHMLSNCLLSHNSVSFLSTVALTSLPASATSSIAHFRKKRICGRN